MNHEVKQQIEQQQTALNTALSRHYNAQKELDAAKVEVDQAMAIIAGLGFADQKITPVAQELQQKVTQLEAELRAKSEEN